MPSKTDKEIHDKIDKKLDELLTVSHNTDKKVVAISVMVGGLKEHVKQQNGRIGRMEMAGVTFLLSVIGYLAYALTSSQLGV